MKRAFFEVPEVLNLCLDEIGHLAMLIEGFFRRSGNVNRFHLIPFHISVIFEGRAVLGYAHYGQAQVS